MVIIRTKIADTRAEQQKLFEEAAGEWL